MFSRILLALILALSVSLPASAEPDPATLHVDETKSSSWRDLASRSDLIVVASVGIAHQSYPTTREVERKQIVNYIQTIQVQQVLKGSSGRLLDVLSTGVEPLPDPPDPLNLKYPGPLAEGRYVLFLHPVKGSGIHSIVGLWQGVYPLFQGRTIALKEAGFPALNNLTIKELERKLESARR